MTDTRKDDQSIRVGIGGWTYAPWRGVFYPDGLRQADELDYASRHVTTIEINGTFYRGQSPESFAKWRDAAPDGFVYAVKGHRAIANKRKLADTAESLGWFFSGGVLELADKLGPVLWQFAPHRKFDAADVAAFLGLLPEKADGRALRHVLEVRHESFLVPEFVRLAREHNVAVVCADADDYPTLADVTAGFVYARLQRARADVASGYPTDELDTWAARARAWRDGGVPDDLPLVDATAPEKSLRPVFVYMINGAKERAPAAAMDLLERLG